MNRAFFCAPLIVATFLVTACTTTDSSIDNAKFTKVGLAEAKELFDRGALFIDLSDDLEYRNGHVKGAVNLDWNEKFGEEELASIADKNREIVFYCYAQCYLSSAASEKASSWGYQMVFQFAEGYPKWESAGFPTEN